jgi:hypothetical protein
MPLSDFVPSDFVPVVTLIAFPIRPNRRTVAEHSPDAKHRRFRVQGMTPIEWSRFDVKANPGANPNSP